MRRVFICSPFRGDVDDNVRIAKEMCRYAISQDCAPIAPHLLYPQFLSDDSLEERVAGINAGLAYLNICHEIWVYDAKGISKGMEEELKYVHTKLPYIDVKYFHELPGDKK